MHEAYWNGLFDTRWEDAPLGPEAIRLVRKLRDWGYSERTRRDYGHAVVHLGRVLHAEEGDVDRVLDEAVVDDFVDRHLPVAATDGRRAGDKSICGAAWRTCSPSAPDSERARCGVGAHSRRATPRLPAGTRRLSKRRLQSGNLRFLPPKTFGIQGSLRRSNRYTILPPTETPFEILFVGDSITWLLLALWVS